MATDDTNKKRKTLPNSGCRGNCKQDEGQAAMILQTYVGPSAQVLGVILELDERRAEMVRKILDGSMDPLCPERLPETARLDKPTDEPAGELVIAEAVREAMGAHAAMRLCDDMHWIQRTEYDETQASTMTIVFDHAEREIHLTCWPGKFTGAAVKCPPPWENKQGGTPCQK